MCWRQCARPSPRFQSLSGHSPLTGGAPRLGAYVTKCGQAVFPASCPAQRPEARSRSGARVVLTRVTYGALVRKNSLRRRGSHQDEGEWPLKTSLISDETVVNSLILSAPVIAPMVAPATSPPIGPPSSRPARQ